MRRELILPPKSAASTVTDPTSWPWRLNTGTANVPVTVSVCSEAIAAVPYAAGHEGDRALSSPGPCPLRVRQVVANPPRSTALAHNADLDVHARRQAESFVQSLDRLHRRLKNVDQPLVRADLELLARLSVDVRRA